MASSWAIVTMPCANPSRGDCSLRDRPPRVIVPSSGSITPEMILPSDDMPAPVAPISARTVPGSMGTATPLSAGTPPNRLDTPTTTRSPSGVSAGRWGCCSIVRPDMLGQNQSLNARTLEYLASAGSARPLASESRLDERVDVGRVQDALVGQARHRVLRTLLLAGLEGLDQHAHADLTFGCRHLKDVGEPRTSARLELPDPGGAAAVADQLHRGVLGRGQGRLSALAVLVRSDDHVDVRVGGQHVLGHGQPHRGLVETVAFGDNRVTRVLGQLGREGSGDGSVRLITLVVVDETDLARVGPIARLVS